jgi:hypothetical protein
MPFNIISHFLPFLFFYFTYYCPIIPFYPKKRRHLTKTNKNFPTKPNPLPRLPARPHAHAQTVPTFRGLQQPALRMAAHRPPENPERGTEFPVKLLIKLSAGFPA